jgi:hypothetical protein
MEPFQVLIFSKSSKVKVHKGKKIREYKKTKMFKILKTYNFKLWFESKFTKYTMHNLPSPHFKNNPKTYL